MSWISSEEATSRLAIARETLYAYVSRGLVHSRPIEGSRRSEYRESDIAALEEKKKWRSDPRRAAAAALDRGPGSIESAVTLVRDGKLYYRGEAFESLEGSSIEKVGALLWDVDSLEFEVRRNDHLSVDRRSMGRALLDAELRDPDAWVFDAHGARALARRLVGEVYSRFGESADCLAKSIALAWDVPAHEEIINHALVCCADHELNVSAFAARCAASAGANLYSACLAGYAAASGHKHTGRVEELFWVLDEFDRFGFEETVRRRRRSGADIHGFGHPLYPDGDPRAASLLRVLESSGFDVGLVSSHEDFHLEAPSIDLALALTISRLGLGAEHGVLLFMLGRLFGWIAHCLEAYESDKLIRPRARYVGKEPDA